MRWCAIRILLPSESAAAPGNQSSRWVRCSRCMSFRFSKSPSGFAAAVRGTRAFSSSRSRPAHFFHANDRSSTVENRIRSHCHNQNAANFSHTERDPDREFCAKNAPRDGSDSPTAQDFFRKNFDEFARASFGGNRAGTLCPSGFAGGAGFLICAKNLARSQNVVPRLCRKQLTLPPVVDTSSPSRVMFNSLKQISHRFIRSASADRKGVSL